MRYVYQNYEKEIGDRNFMGDLNVLDMIDFDVILRMNWLSKHRASEICQGKKVVFDLDGEMRLVFQGDKIVCSLIILLTILRRMTRKRGTMLPSTHNGCR